MHRMGEICQHSQKCPYQDRELNRVMADIIILHGPFNLLETTVTSTLVCHHRPCAGPYIIPITTGWWRAAPVAKTQSGRGPRYTGNSSSEIQPRTPSPGGVSWTLKPETRPPTSPALPNHPPQRDDESEQEDNRSGGLFDCQRPENRQLTPRQAAEEHKKERQDSG